MNMLRVVLVFVLCLIAVPPAATASHVAPFNENQAGWKDLRLRAVVEAPQPGNLGKGLLVTVKRTDRAGSWRFGVRKGRRILALETSNNTVAWAEWRLISRGRYRTDIWSQRLLPRKSRRVLVTSRIRTARKGRQYPVVIGVADDQRVAVQFGRDLITLGKSRGRLRTVDSGNLIGIPDGRTIWWKSGELRYRSLLAPPMVGQCPLFQGFSVLAEPDGHLLTAGVIEGYGGVTFACRRDDGRVSIMPTGYLVGYSGSVVLMGYYDAPRAYFTSAGAFTYNLASEKKLRMGSLGDVRLGSATSTAVTPAGRAAWVEGTTLMALPAEDGKPVITLDEGVITDLRADGERFAWTSGGVAKSEPAP
jgi:hypothetical protein